MSAYFAANIRIHDPQTYEQYLAAVDGVFEKYRGKYLAVDGAPSVLEGDWDYTRFVLIEFPSEKDLRDWYESDDYQDILKFRLKGAQCDSLLVRGLDEK